MKAPTDVKSGTSTSRSIVSMRSPEAATAVTLRRTPPGGTANDTLPDGTDAPGFAFTSPSYTVSPVTDLAFSVTWSIGIVFGPNGASAANSQDIVTWALPSAPLTAPAQTRNG